MSATVPTGLELENPELTLASIDECEEFPEELVRRVRGRLLGVELAFVGTEAMRFAEFFQCGRELMGGRAGGLAPSAEPVVMTGAALGLPGAETVFGNVRVRLGRHLRAAMGS